MHFPAKTNLPLRRWNSGFTLLEVILGVMILGLLAGVLFTLVETTLAAATQLSTKQGQTQELNGLVEICRETFATLDGRAQFTAAVKPSTGGGYAQELRVENGPLAFAWQGSGAETGVTMVAPRPQANGLLAFCLLHEREIDPKEQEKAPPPKPKWFVLVRDLKKLEWRFFDPRSNAWRKEWEEATVRPSLVELIIQSPASPEELRLVFPMLAATPQ
ncbi:MAG TPA: prepilin-type N-terminal cleavage/methylation domain-containing protein [Chthoniobacterales bacterium]|jgi:prepilin-type N-terminal cleavage/methylation domain-containing protein